jgi:hypothetical protein
MTATWAAVLCGAQEPAAEQPIAPVRVRVLAHGAGEPRADAWRLARSEGELRDLIARERIEMVVPRLDFATHAVVVVHHGRGRGGTPTVTTWNWGREASALLIRLAGDRQAATVQGRWAVLLVPCAVEPWRNNLRFETDVAGQPVGEAWRSVLMPCQLGRLDHLDYLGTASLEVGCYQDEESWRRFWRRNSAADVPVPACDFAVHVLLSAPIRRLQGAGVLWAPLRLTARVVAPRAEEPPQAVAIFAVPRRAGELVVEATSADDETRHHLLARFVVADAASAVVLRRFECNLEPRAAACCERATTRSEWRALRDRLGGPVQALPDDWCNFTHDTVVALATAAAPARPGFGLAVTQEEGVDVLTVTRELVRDQERLSAALVLKVPRRKHQLAVVLRQAGAKEAESEATLQVFPGF